MDINEEKQAIKINENFVLIENSELVEIDIDLVDSSKKVEINGIKYNLKKCKYKIDDYKIWEIIENKNLKQHSINTHDRSINWLIEMDKIRKEQRLNKLSTTKNNQKEDNISSVLIGCFTISVVVVGVFFGVIMWVILCLWVLFGDLIYIIFK